MLPAAELTQWTTPQYGKQMQYTTTNVNKYNSAAFFWGVGKDWFFLHFFLFFNLILYYSESNISMTDRLKRSLSQIPFPATKINDASKQLSFFWNKNCHLKIRLEFLLYHHFSLYVDAQMVVMWFKWKGKGGLPFFILTVFHGALSNNTYYPATEEITFFQLNCSQKQTIHTCS
jgi:hypothetical protein